MDVTLLILDDAAMPALLAGLGVCAADLIKATTKTRLVSIAAALAVLVVIGGYLLGPLGNVRGTIIAYSTVAIFAVGAPLASASIGRRVGAPRGVRAVVNLLLTPLSVWFGVGVSNGIACAASSICP